MVRSKALLLIRMLIRGLRRGHGGMTLSRALKTARRR